RSEGEHQAGCGDGEHDDPVGVGEPVAQVPELARQEAVAGEQRREPREALVGSVRREDQDRESEGLDEVVEGRARRARGEGGGCGTVACGQVPTVHFVMPTPSITYMTARNA